MSATIARPLGERLPSAQERKLADRIRQVLAAASTDDADTPKLQLVGKAGKTADIVLTHDLARLLMEVMRHISKGDAVTLVPVRQMLTTQQAADILNVSRPHLISLIEKNSIPYELVGRHRRIKAENLFAYKKARDETRARALADLAALDADII